MKITIGKITLFSILIFATQAVADLAGEVSAFYSCYSHLTGERPKRNSSLLLQVKNQTLLAIDACKKILDETELGDNGQLTDLNSETSKLVLKTFQNLHASWFRNRDIQQVLGVSRCRTDPTEEFYDSTEPALFITKALFQQKIPFSSILKGYDSYQAIRHLKGNTSDTGPIHSIKKSWITNKDGSQIDLSFNQAGDILGVKPSQSFPFNNKSNSYQETLVHKSAGGGLLGSQPYLLLNLSELNYKVDGDESIYRKFSQSVYKDILCRDLPVIRIGDVEGLVKGSPHAIFKRSNSCVQCHATIDPFAGVVRNQFVTDHKTGPGCSSKNRKFFHSFSKKITSPEFDAWNLPANQKYSTSPPKGKIYYRSYDGELVDINVNDLNQAGIELTKQKDFYVCAAKKYYEYFTGSEVSLEDEKDPLEPLNLTENQKFHRDTVIGLGLRFMKHQDPKKLIKEIFIQPTYKNSSIYRSLASESEVD